jgi:ubiquinone biosynthesis protein Coq4
MSLTIDRAIADLVALRDKEKEIEQAKKQAEALIVTLFSEAGIDHYETTDKVRVAVENRPRRSFDMDTLLAQLPATVLTMVLKQTVDSSAFDSAVETGLVPTPVVDQAVTTSYSTQVRVYGQKGVRGERS